MSRPNIFFSLATKVTNRYLLTSTLFVISLPFAPVFADAKIKSFQYYGKQIRTEWFYCTTPGAGTKNVLLVLPGSGGIEAEGGFYRDLSQTLTKSGATVVMIHYMDSSRLKQANSAQMSAHFDEWLAVIHQSIDFVEKQPGFGHMRISLLGHSLGAQLALHEASSDSRVYGVVDMAGSFVRPTKNIQRMPRVLILHGRADTIVPVARERQLVEVLRRTKSPFSEHLFPRVDHLFNNITFEELSNLIIEFLK